MCGLNVVKGMNLFMRNVRNLSFYEGTIKSLNVTYNGKIKTSIEEQYIKDSYFYLDGKDFIEVESDKMLLDRNETLDLMDYNRNSKLYKNHVDLEYRWQFIDTYTLEKVIDENLIHSLTQQVNIRKKEEEKKKKSLFKLNKRKKGSHK